MRNINLALSGGGIRAMVFHLGVLRFLAEQGELENIRRISAVSGGSLITGMILQEAGVRWPASSHFMETIYPALRRKLCSRSLIADMLKQLIQPENFRFLLSRANILGKALEKSWGITATLDALPSSPEISFEGTTAENGKRFRFRRDTLGDYDLGYASARDFPLAQALAVSAAFPGGIGPLQLDTRRWRWYGGGFGQRPESDGACLYPSLHLYDGGVYDNLGLEPFFDARSGRPKTGCADGFLLVSDAGSPFHSGFSYGVLNPLRLKRVLDIAMEQCRSLRVRSLIGYLNQAPENGAYLWINTRLPGDEALKSFAAAFPTTLRKLSEQEFDKLAQCGYLVAQARLKAAAPLRTDGMAASAAVPGAPVAEDVEEYYHTEEQ